MKYACCLSLLASLLPATHATAQSPAPPNVIVIMTDDQGYGDLSCHGNPIIQTPHLDRLHSQSVRLTDFHAAPMCTPTRGQLLSGLDAARNGAINVSSGRTLLRRELPTLADIFAAAGYRTGIFGKWHLGDTYPYRPQDRGFEETLWFPSSHINSVPDAWDNDYFDDTYRRNSVPEKHVGYCTDVFFREAIAWLKKLRATERERPGENSSPFFLYLPTNAPHAPYWLPQPCREAMTRRLAEAESSGAIQLRLPPQQRANLIDFLAMIQNVDDNVGRLDDYLQQAGLFDNTVVVFLTDNGSTLGHLYYNAGMRGHKTQLWEGGHRVPCFIRHPAGRLGEPRDVDVLAQVQDLFPTLAALCGLSEIPATDGVDLSPILLGQAPIDEDRMLVINYSRMPQGLDYPTPDSPSLMRRDGAAVLWRHWRLLEDRELYNLTTDPLQQHNVINAHPHVAAHMRAHLDAWWNRVGRLANEPQPVVIGHAQENPVMLTACEWLDVFIDQQRQIRRGDRKNGWWEVEVAEAGEYEFELRRWPRGTGLSLNAPLDATTVTDGTLLPGAALPIARARLRIGSRLQQVVDLKDGAESATFTVRLGPGRTRLYTWFDDADGQPLLGAYYVYVRRT